ncbi:MAG: cadmium resistance transporter [Lachnospiraceae bacterium]|nr:cadmium resistance transporter [Lachnospiraceae bacterium]
MTASILTSIIAFVSTNIDDIFVLMLLFSQADNRRGKSRIVIGHFLGISLLVLLSFLGAFGLQFVPTQYVGLLGIVPIALGIKAWLEYRREEKEASAGNFSPNDAPFSLSQSDSESTPSEVNPCPNSSDSDPSDELISVPEYLYPDLFPRNEASCKPLAAVTSVSLLNALIVTIAGGADNVGVYIPLFVGYSVGERIAAVIIFAVLTLLWCFFGDALASLPVIRKTIQKYKQIAIPLIFILLGVYIILDSGLLGMYFHAR